jgi:putative DNA primase/helicase
VTTTPPVGRSLAIGHELGLKRDVCPCGCGYGLSLCDGADGRLLVHCYGGCDFSEIFAELVQYGLLDGDDVDLDAPPGDRIVPDRDDDRRRNKIQQARAIYASGVWDERIDVYLRARGIGLTSPILKFHEQAPHRLGVRLPAMLAPIVDIDGEQIGTHLTYLSRDGATKAALPKEYQRECRGALAGGAIRLIPFDPGVELVLAEGVESGLSAAQLFALPCWSAVYAGGLRSLALPRDLPNLIIAADNDASGVGQRNALAAYDRWTAEGRSVRIKIPPNAGDDFNDVLTKRRRDARH